MANRRMFSLQIIDSDAFLDMSSSTQNLYFHLCMRADDDGFVSNPKKIMKIIGSNPDDLKVLLTKRFLLSFDNGIIVIKHWRIHNYIAKDRYKKTTYQEEKNKLTVKDNGSYTECIQDVYNMETQVRLGKVSIGKDRLDKINNNISAGAQLEEAGEEKQSNLNQQSSQAHSAPNKNSDDLEFKFHEAKRIVYLSQQSYDKLIAEYGHDVTHDYIQRVAFWEKNTTVKSAYRRIINWTKRDGIKPLSAQKNTEYHNDDIRAKNKRALFGDQ